MKPVRRSMSVALARDVTVTVAGMPERNCRAEAISPILGKTRWTKLLRSRETVLKHGNLTTCPEFGQQRSIAKPLMS